MNRIQQSRSSSRYRQPIGTLRKLEDKLDKFEKKLEKKSRGLDQITNLSALKERARKIRKINGKINKVKARIENQQLIIAILREKIQEKHKTYPGNQTSSTEQHKDISDEADDEIEIEIEIEVEDDEKAQNVCNLNDNIRGSTEIPPTLHPQEIQSAEGNILLKSSQQQ